MKKLLLLASLTLGVFNANAQIGATAPDFNVTDLDGNQIRLYQDILDQGLIAVIDVSATWCGPCWSLHNSHVLQELHELYGPNGSNQLRVVFYEGDAATTLADLQGSTGSTQGNWLEGSTYPFVNESPLSLNMNVWAPQGFPTLNIIRPSDKQIVADPWNVLTLAGQVEAISSSTGIALSGVGIDEVSSNSVSFAYPNPASSLLTVDLSAFNNKPATLEIYTLQGKLIVSEIRTSSLENMNISEIPSGNYLLRAFNTEVNQSQVISVVH